MSIANDTDATPGVTEEPALPSAILQLTAKPDGGPGFTIGLALASQSQAADAETFRVPLVDIVAIALMQIAAEATDDLKARINKINTAITELGEALERGEFAEDALKAFNQATGGVLGARA